MNSGREGFEGRVGAPLGEEGLEGQLLLSASPALKVLA